MKIQLLAGAAVAALIGLASPALGAAASPAIPDRSSVAGTSSSAVESFYAHRANAPLWLTGGQPNAAALRLLEVLDRAQLDNFASGPALAAHARALLARGATNDAERALSNAFALYAAAMRTPPPGMTFADSWVMPRQASAGQLLATAAAAPSLADHVTRIANANPIYAELRDAAWRSLQATGARPDQRVLASLERARSAPFQARYIMVDTASATLWMIENGRIVDQMPVIVGKAASATPMLASTIYRATFNPYWHVPSDLVQTLIAPKVLAQGVGYLDERQYEVLDAFGPDARPVDPKTVDWKAVAAGTATVRVRQQPSAANSMGQMKFGFPNDSDIYLHDTPNKDLFAEASRALSNGCIRLSDAPRLARWLLGRDARADGEAAEQDVLLPTPVPIYVTYLTAHARGGELAFVNDVYGKDSSTGVAMAARR